MPWEDQVPEEPTPPAAPAPVWELHIEAAGFVTKAPPAEDVSAPTEGEKL